MVTDSGVDHVRLAYHYLDSGDLDGYGSLLHAGLLGVAELERPAIGARHHITRIVADGDCVVAMGRVAPQQREFVDVFTSPRRACSGPAAATTPALSAEMGINHHETTHGGIARGHPFEGPNGWCVSI